MSVLALVAASLLAVPSVTPAQPDGIPAELLKMLGDDDEPHGKNGDFPPLDKVTEGMTRIDGFITLFQNEEKNELYALFPTRLESEPFMVATSVTRGSFAGYQWSDMLVQLERVDRDLLFVMPNTFQTASGTLEEVVENTYPDQILGKARIRTMDKSGYLIDIGGFLESINGAATGFYSRGSVTTVGLAKGYPQNTEVELFFRSVGGGDDMGVHYSMSRLPKTDYKPREADLRLGYFLTVQEDFSKPETDDTRFVRYVNRWHLKKADPDLEMSPPEEPIVFYVDKSVPVKYRKAVRDGILEWNRAFEKVGIVDAMVVRQQTEDNEFADLEPGDVRYNFFRWIASGRSFAMGPSRVNPLTGQILDADIIFDEGMVRSYAEDFDIEVDRLFNDALSLEDRQHFMLYPWEHPAWDKIQRDYATMAIEEGAKTPPLGEFMADRLEVGRLPYAHRSCEIGAELAQQVSFATMALEMELYGSIFDNTLLQEGGEPVMDEAGSDEAADDAAGDAKTEEKSEDEQKKELEKKKQEFEKLREKVREDLIQQMVREVTMHEVGHTLGLRHNYKASAWKTLDEILAAKRDEPIVGSVMEYAGLAIPAEFEKMGPYANQTLGPYDYWVIEYGYAIPGQNDQPGKEDAMLAAIAGRMADPSLLYATDEDMRSPDPTINVWDLGDNPLDFARYNMDRAAKLMPEILTRVVEDGEYYAKARSAYGVLLYKYFQAASVSAKFIGGHYISRSYKGDKDSPDPIRVVEAERQREAMDLIADRILAKGAIPLDPKLQRFLAANRWGHQGSNAWSADLVYPIQDTIKSLHRNVLASLFSTTRIRDLYDSAYRVDPGTDIFTIPEMMDRLTKAIFGELITPATGEWTIANPMIDDIRRTLQREYVSRLIQTALRDETSTTPAVVRSLAYAELERVRDLVDGAKGTTGTDAYTKAHLDELSRRITKTLDADFTINAAGGGGLGMLSFLFGQPSGPGSGAASMSDRDKYESPAGVRTPRRDF
jgi:hypothetical protein